MISLILVALLADAPTRSIEWINTPEAYFATAKEREEWFRIEDDDLREAFRRRYWLMRDPTLATERNEFREIILDRIVKADQRFPFTGGLRGSETAQGLVFIVLGPPSRVRNTYSRMEEQTNLAEFETITSWIYDVERPPNLLKMLGRPELQVDIVVEPDRRRDVLQAPGIFDHYRQTLSERSVVNPRANVPLAPPMMKVVTVGLDAPLPDRMRTILREAQPVARFGDITITAGDLWTGNGSTAIIKAAVANAGDRTTHLTIYGELRSGDRIVATFSEPFMTCEALDAAPGTKTCLLRLDVPPGAYDASIAVLDDRTGEKLTAISKPLRVFDPSGDFALSSIVLSGEPTRGGDNLFTLADVTLHPRGDERFSINESLWFFATLRSTAGASAITADLQLRRNGKPVAAHSFAPNLTEIAPSVFRFGQELPLGQFVPGDYTLYLTVRRDGAEPEVRRTDFQIVP